MPAQIYNTYPVDGEIEFPMHSRISIRFNEQMDRESVE
ncbi:MAG: Ig-like domain-containing protein [bacterium]